MIPARFSLLLQIDLPSPPVPGGEAVTEWWRVIALIVVTVLTTGILALIFRPAVPAPSPEGHGDQTGPSLHTVPANVAPLRRASDKDLATTVIPFPGVDREADVIQAEQSAEAAAERLRRITRHSGEQTGSRRRRLGSRAGQSSAAQATSNQEELATDRIGTGIAVSDCDKQGDAAGASGEEGEMAGTPDSWDLLGEISDRLPSSADALPNVPPGFISPDDLDLLGDIANRSPSEMDRMISETTNPAQTISGDPPTADEVERMAERPPHGKIVQFVPRQPSPAESTEIDPAYELLNEVQAQTDSVITQFPVDLTTRERITATVQELLFCANVGEFIHGFALYTDKFLFTFMDQSGLNEDEFRERFSSIPPRDPADWTRVESIREFRRLDDGRIAATVEYRNGGKIAGRERYVFKLDTQVDRWLIDDISPAN